MDLEEQGRIAQLVEESDGQSLVVLLGTPSPGATQMVAMTLREGDPSFAGPLAGVPLGLPVHHILEDEVKATVDADVYEEHVGPMELVLDADKIKQALEVVRERTGP